MANAPTVISMLASAVLATLSDAAAGQDTTRATDRDTITAAIVRARAQAPPVMSVTVSGARVREVPSSSPWDLMRHLTGIEIREQGQGPGLASEAAFRGTTSHHSSDVLFVLDGVPINLPVHGHTEGYADWNVLVPPAIAEIGVISGPASPRYGDFAFGGVVETVTDVAARDGSAAVHGSSAFDVGGWLRTGTMGSRGGNLLALHGMRQEGWRDHSSFWSGTGILRGWLRLGRAQVDGGLTIYRSVWDSPGFRPAGEPNNNMLRLAVDSTDGGEAQRQIAHVGITTPLGSGVGLHVTAWAQRARSQMFLNLPGFGAPRQFEERDRRFALGGRSELIFNAAGGHATVGVDVRRDASTFDLDSTTRRATVGRISAYDADYLSGGLYARWRGHVVPRLLLDLGARFDALAYESHSRLFFTPTPRTTVGLVSPKVAASYRIAPRLVLSASLSRGFRGAPGVIHKPDQPPMMVRAAEIGVRFLAGRVVADLAAFRLDIGHERIRDPVTRDVSDAGESVRQGLTAHAEIRLTQDVDAFVRGTWNDARMSRSVDPTPHVVRWSVSGHARLAPSAHEIHRDPLEPGDRVPGVSQYLGSMGFEAMLGSIKLRTTWRFNGPFTPIGEPDITTTRYLLLDFIAAMPLTPTLAINAELINAFNTLYPEVRAYGYVNPGVLRTVRLTLTYVGAPTRSGHRPSPETPSE